MMLNELREAERRKLEELSKKLAEIQQQVANLIRRQAGHNLDNLSLQDKPVDKLDPLSHRSADQGERVKDHLPAQTPLPQLTSAQKDERNTRDIAQTSKVFQRRRAFVEPVQSRDEDAASDRRAAQQGTRARVRSAAGGCLAALVDAKQIIDEQKAKVDQKLDEQKKEAVAPLHQDQGRAGEAQH